jgi:hypothetical protein
VRAHHEPLARDGEDGALADGHPAASLEERCGGRVGDHEPRGGGHVQRFGGDPDRQETGQRDRVTERPEQQHHAAGVEHHRDEKRQQDERRARAGVPDGRQGVRPGDLPEGPEQDHTGRYQRQRHHTCTHHAPGATTQHAFMVSFLGDGSES